MFVLRRSRNVSRKALCRRRTFATHTEAGPSKGVDNYDGEATLPILDFLRKS